MDLYRSSEDRTSEQASAPQDEPPASSGSSCVPLHDVVPTTIPAPSAMDLKVIACPRMNGASDLILPKTVA